MVNEPDTPTKEEIAELPPWAWVAFAARCVQPVYTAILPTAPQQRIDAIDKVISDVETAASSAGITASPPVVDNVFRQSYGHTVGKLSPRTSAGRAPRCRCRSVLGLRQSCRPSRQTRWAMATVATMAQS